MSRRQDDNLRWVLIEPGVLVRVEGDAVTGLLIYGDVSAKRLREIRLARLDHIPHTQGVGQRRPDDGSIPLPKAFPEWRQAQPPTPAQVGGAEPGLGKKGVATLVPRGGARTPAALRREIVSSTVKQSNESAEDFYARFARMYQAVAATTPSPNQLIAEVAGISSNLIKQYVHRARALGYLPPSRRSR